MTKNFYLANSCTWQWNKLAQKMGNMAFLDSEIIIVIVFRMFDLTIHLDKMCLAFFIEEILRNLYMVRLHVISAINWPSIIS